MMEFLINNWSVILAVIAILIVAGFAVYKFVGLPTDEQLNKVREWLLWAVTQAEADLGGGTGQLKLRYVYDLFIERFQWLNKMISFELFSDMVDDALEEMRKMLENNKAINSLVNGDGCDETA